MEGGRRAGDASDGDEKEGLWKDSRYEEEFIAVHARQITYQEKVASSTASLPVCHLPF